MMENKIVLKKYIGFFLLAFVLFVLLFGGIHHLEYQAYTKNYNQKITNILSLVQEKYPEISQNELIEILNSKEIKEFPFDKYGIDVKKEAILFENDTVYHDFNGFEMIFLIGVFLFFFLLLIKYNRKRDKEINKITQCIEEINRKNYTLNLDELSEDELSILKNEIYKTMITLKESAENEHKDKKELKQTLEDISHQLKTPLTSILIILDNLIDHPQMTEVKKQEFIRDIKREVHNMNFLVQNLLKLSQFEVNTIHFNKAPVKLNKLVQESIQKVNTLCDLKNITIKVEGAKEIQMVCDFHWQVQALSNILKNAIEYSQEKSKIKVSYEQNKVYTKIVIEDTGKGISKKDLPHIFERFYKGTKATADSVGIGLALAKRIIEEDNGTIEVASNAKGTIFIIKYFAL